MIVSWHGFSFDHNFEQKLPYHTLLNKPLLIKLSYLWQWARFEGEMPIFLTQNFYHLKNGCSSFVHTYLRTRCQLCPYSSWQFDDFLFPVVQRSENQSPEKKAMDEMCSCLDRKYIHIFYPGRRAHPLVLYCWFWLACKNKAILHPLMVPRHCHDYCHHRRFARGSRLRGKHPIWE